jgi:hypothetical protein
VQIYKLDTAKAQDLVSLRLANGKVVGTMDTIARVKMWIGEHVSEDWMWVTDLVGYDVIVGQPWLETYDVVKRYSDRTITFCSLYCLDYCLQRTPMVGATSATWYGCSLSIGIASWMATRRPKRLRYLLTSSPQIAQR